MGDTGAAWYDLLDGLEDLGRLARANPDPIPDDDTLTRQVEADQGPAGLLDGGTVDGDLLTDLRDAYNDGRRPDLIDLDQVAAAVLALGVPAVVIDTSGGTWTLYAGELDEGCEDDDPMRYPVAMGPGDPDHTGHAEDLSYGPTDDVQEGVGIEEGAMPADIAAGIVSWVQLVENGG